MPASETDQEGGNSQLTQSGTRPPRLLFLTHAESGQSSVPLAVIHALRSRLDPPEMHLASFAPLACKASPGVTFHQIAGQSMRETGTWMDRLHRSENNVPGFQASRKVAEGLIPTLVPYAPEEYVAIARDVERVVEEIQADYVVVDTLFQQAIDAVQRLKVEHCLLSPNTTKDVVLKDLGVGAINFPILATGYPYPIPWYLRPLNAIAGARMEDYADKICPHALALRSARREAGYDWALPMPNPNQTTLTICVTTPGLDYPLPLPSRIRCVGPILRPASAVREADPDLADWLEHGGRRTVMIAFGMHFRVDEQFARDVYAGVAAVLREHSDVQVLWKLSKHGEYATPGMEGAELGKGWDDRLRVVDWLKPEPIDILRSGKVGVVVHHGGSNSYHEALATGVPQVIMSAWLDCHDFGPRAEYMGVGVWGNKRAAPKFDADEFTNALLQVLRPAAAGTTQSSFAVRAREVRAGIEKSWAIHELHDAALQARVLDTGAEVGSVEGRDIAAEIICRAAADGPVQG